MLAFVREEGRVRAHVVVLDERLSGDHGAIRISGRVLPPVGPMALLVLAISALRRVSRLAAYPVAFLRGAGFLPCLGPGTR